MMARFTMYMLVVLAAVLVVHATARNFPSSDTTTNPSNKIHEGLSENTVDVATAEAPSPSGHRAGVKDKKNFITYGGIGGWAGVGYAGVIPTLGSIGGGVGGIGGIGGASGIGGIGGVGGVSGIDGGIGGGKIIP